METGIIEEKQTVCNSGSFGEFKTKTIGANWIRKGGMLGAGIAFTAIGAAIIYATATGKLGSSDYPNWVVYLLGAFFALVAIAATAHTFLSLFADKVTFDPSGITVKTIFGKYEIPSNKIIRVDSYTETVSFAPFMTMKRFTIITPAKSLELCDHDFWGLESSLNKWLAAFTPAQNVEKSRIDDVVWNKNLITNTRLFLGVDGDNYVFTKYRGVYKHDRTMMKEGEIVMNRYLDKLRSLIQPEKEVLRTNKSEIRDVNIMNVAPTEYAGNTTYSSIVSFKVNEKEYKFTYASNNQDKLEYFNSLFS